MRRATTVLAVAVTLGGLLGGLLANYLLAVATRTADNADELDRSKAALEALAGQVEALGGDPVVEPRDVVDDGSMLIPGPIGQMGPRGATGADGLPGVGQPGADGQPGVDGAQGEPGADGTDGAPGANGADGAQGPPGPAPQSFSFRVQGQNYICTDPDLDGQYQCAFG